MNRWIPVTERMPEEGDMVLVSLGQDRGRYGKVDVDYWKADGENDWYYFKDEVVAWRPMPKPYEEDTND